MKIETKQRRMAHIFVVLRVAALSESPTKLSILCYVLGLYITSQSIQIHLIDSELSF